MADEKTIKWEMVASFPDLARHLATQKGEIVKVELGWEISPTGIRTEKFLMHIMRLIRDNWHYYSETYTRTEFRGAYTAHKFKTEAALYFKQMEETAPTLN